MGISIWQLLILLGGFFILFVPCIAAGLSRKARGRDKFFWLALSLAFSWIGYLAYYFVRIRKPGNSRDLGRIHLSDNR